MQVCLHRLDGVHGMGMPLLSPRVWGAVGAWAMLAQLQSCPVPCWQAAWLLPGPTGYSLCVERHVEARNAQGQRTLPSCTVRLDFPAASPSHCMQIHP